MTNAGIMPKLYTCKVCKAAFQKLRPLQRVCSPTCALSHAKTETEKKVRREERKERQETRAKLDAMKTKPQLVAAAQKAFNAFIRARDAGKPCISCGAHLPAGGVGGGFDAGHYRSRGAAPHLAFVEDNCHGQCKRCNQHLAGNAVAYRMGLVERIGARNVELLESDETLRRYTKEALIELARYYREQERKLKAAHG